MRKKQTLLIFALVSTAVLLKGCTAAIVGGGAAGTVAYAMGDLKAVEPKNLGTVHEATLKAVKELGLNVTRDTKDALSAVTVVRDAQDKKITVKLKATTEETTKLSIRVGVFGNETKSRLIYQKIHDNLQK